MAHIGIDEKSFLKGHRYATIMSDLDNARVLDVARDRKEESLAELKRHLDNILTYLKHRITNAVAEGINSKIQQVKSAARGFRNFENYRTAILFFCGKLDLYPQESQ